MNNAFGFIKKFLPKPRRELVVGFDIGTSFIKAVEMVPSDESIEIQRWAVEPIKNSDPQEALKSLCKNFNITNQIPVASVSGKGTLIRYVDMPRMSIEELRKSFIYEIDKYFPFEPQSIYTDCFILDPQGKDKKMSVLVVAAKKELVDDRIKIFKEAGLDLSFVTTNSIAMANAFERLVKGEGSTGARAILDIGGSVSNLMILDKNHTPCFTRDIFIGSQDMSKQIANSLGVDIATADELKRSPGAKLEEIIQSCEASLENLIGELHLSFDYFTTERNTPVVDLFLVGGGSLFKGIETAFEKSINIPVKIWDPLMGVNLGSQIDTTKTASYSSQLGVAIGLALTKI